GGAGDGQLNAALTTLRSLCDAAEAAGQERAYLNGVLASGAFTTADYPAFVQVAAAKTNAVALVRRTASPAVDAELDGLSRSPAAVAVAAMEKQAFTGYAAQRLPMTSADWWQAATGVVDGLHGVQAEAERESTVRATEIRSAALWDLGWDLVL